MRVPHVQRGPAHAAMEVSLVNLATVQRQRVQTHTLAGDNEVLVHVLPVQVGPTNRLRVNVRPVDVATVHRQAKGANRSGGNEVLIHVLPVQVGPTDRVGYGVRPVVVAAVHRHPVGVGDVSDETLVLVLTLPFGPPSGV